LNENNRPKTKKQAWLPLLIGIKITENEIEIGLVPVDGRFVKP
jgi:hypothetical protein